MDMDLSSSLMEMAVLLDDDEDGGRRSERSEVGGRRSEELGLASTCPCWRGWARRVADQAACVGDDVPALLVLGHPGTGVDERVRGVLRRLAVVRISMFTFHFLFSFM